MAWFVLYHACMTPTISAARSGTTLAACGLLVALVAVLHSNLHSSVDSDSGGASSGPRPPASLPHISTPPRVRRRGSSCGTLRRLLQARGIAAPSEPTEAEGYSWHEIVFQLEEGLYVVHLTRLRESGNLDDFNPLSLDQAHVVPVIDDGEPRGYKLFSVQPNSYWAAFGLQNRDVLLSVNGLPLTGCSEVFSRLRESVKRGESVVLQLERDGKPTSITYSFIR